MKIARAYTKRPAVICFEDAFHGRTLLAVSLTSKTQPYKTGVCAVRPGCVSRAVRVLLPLLVRAYLSFLPHDLRAAS